MAQRTVSSGGTYERVAAIIENDRQELVDLCLRLGNMPSPHGREREVAQVVVEWLRENGIDGYLQPITEQSANAVGQIPGSDDGTSLILDAHIDTWTAVPADAPGRIKKIQGAWVEGDLLYGYGVINDKAQVAAFMVAARALQKAGLKPRGDLTVAGVAFETGSPSVDEQQGIEFPGEGFGSRWMIDRAVTADYALIGETTDFGIVTAECGDLRLKITLEGRTLYTPRVERSLSLAEHPNAIVRMAHVVQALEEWALQYEQRQRFEFARGTIIPKAQVERIRGIGGSASIYFDIRLLPGANPRAVAQEVRQLINHRGFACQVSAYQWSRGYIAQGAEPLIDAVEEAHRFVFGRPSATPPSDVLSMWRDLNAFNEVGIPSVCYGPPRQKELFSDDQNRCMRIADLVAATKVYALTALGLCGFDQ